MIVSTSVSPRKARRPGQHFVQNCAHAEDVAAVVHCLCPQLLGRHIGDGADYDAAFGDGG